MPLLDVKPKHRRPRVVRARVTRTATIPDQVRLARYRHAPEHGPSLLFFSGGTALNEVSKRLVAYTHNSVHLITPFDSGGSSGKLRGPFRVLGVGDLRSRLMALADRTTSGQSEVFEIFSHRFPTDAAQFALHDRLERMAAGQDPLIRKVTSPMRNLICNHLRYFLSGMPDNFDLRGASIGNLVLVGGYVNNDYDIESVLYLFSQLVEVRGTVKPIVDVNAQLVARLEDGTALVGQHLLGGKDAPPIASPVAEVYLVDRPCHESRIVPVISDHNARLIREADLICYPMGSFYSSIIANLLPRGVAQAVRDNVCPKVYVPNIGPDPEQMGMSLVECVDMLLTYLRKGCGVENSPETLLNYVILDNDLTNYGLEVDLQGVLALGIDVIETSLVKDSDPQRVDPEKMITTLLSLT